MSLNPLVTAITPPEGNSGGVAETEVPLLQQIVNLLSNGAASPNGSIAVNGTAYAYDYQSIAYIGATNNIDSITYRSGGAGGSIVAVTRFNYANGGSANDDRPTVIATTTT